MPIFMVCVEIVLGLMSTYGKICIFILKSKNYLDVEVGNKPACPILSLPLGSMGSHANMDRATCQYGLGHSACVLFGPMFG